MRSTLPEFNSRAIAFKTNSFSKRGAALAAVTGAADSCADEALDATDAIGIAAPAEAAELEDDDEAAARVSRMADAVGADDDEELEEADLFEPPGVCAIAAAAAVPDDELEELEKPEFESCADRKDQPAFVGTTPAVGGATTDIGLHEYGSRLLPSAFPESTLSKAPVVAIRSGWEWSSMASPPFAPKLGDP